MDLGIEGRRAIVPAASGGLGLAVAHALAAAGVRVAMCSSDRERIEGAAAEVGAGAVPLVADVTSAEGATGLIDDAEQALGGPPDILILNGPGPPPGTFASTPVELYGQAIERLIVPGGRSVPARRAGDARARLGPRRRDHVDRGPPADADADPLQHRAHRPHLVPQDDGARGRRRRRHRELRSARAPRHAAPARDLRRPPRRAGRADPGAAGSAASPSSARSSPSSAPSTPPTSPVPRSRSTAAPTSACSSGRLSRRPRRAARPAPPRAPGSARRPRA